MTKIRTHRLVRLGNAKRRTLGIEGPYVEALVTLQPKPPA